MSDLACTLHGALDLRVQPRADASATGGEEVDANGPARTEAPACD